MIGIKKMMKAGQGSGASPAAAARPDGSNAVMAEDESSLPTKRMWTEVQTHQDVSGDLLDDNFLVEGITAGEGRSGTALDGGSDSDDDEKERRKDKKKLQNQALKEMKRARVGESVRREDGAAAASGSADEKAAFFLVHSLLVHFGPLCKA